MKAPEHMMPTMMRLLALVFLAALVGLPSGAAAQDLAFVSRIIDGDTIGVIIGNRTETVRYIGINTPEIHHPTKGREPYGDLAREINRALVNGKWVYLYYDVQQRDRYGRLLAYVYIDGRLVNADLVQQGYAETATYPPNVHFAEHFRTLERGARESKRGLWADPQVLEYHRPFVPPAATDTPTVTQPRASSPSRSGNVWTYEGPASITVPAQGFSGGSATGSSSSGAVAPPASGGGPVQVDGYRRSDGTYVAPHTRSAPRR